MKPRVSLFAAALVGALVAVVLPAGPASAQPAGRDWLWANDARQVAMHETDPTAADPYVHVKFKRYGGEGQRQVRILEQQRRPTTPVRYSKAVKLLVGEKVVFTTKGSMPCEPEKRPLRVDLQLRFKLPGKPWERWITWTSSTHVLMEC